LHAGRLGLPWTAEVALVPSDPMRVKPGALSALLRAVAAAPNRIPAGVS